MKDLGHDRRILGTINTDRSNFCLFVQQTPCVLKILKRFCILDWKPASEPLENHFILSKDQSFANEKKKIL